MEIAECCHDWGPVVVVVKAASFLIITIMEQLHSSYSEQRLVIKRAASTALCSATASKICQQWS
jgi:hypothetical protein